LWSAAQGSGPEFGIDPIPNFRSQLGHMVDIFLYVIAHSKTKNYNCKICKRRMVTPQQMVPARGGSEDCTVFYTSFSPCNTLLVVV
jgi:hypothetical protein